MHTAVDGGVPKDPVKAADCYSSCAAVIPWACFEWFDMCYENNLGFSRNLTDCLSRYSEAGDQEAVTRAELLKNGSCQS